MPNAHQAFDHWLSTIGPLRLALEGRVGWEFGALFAAQPWLAQSPWGDGHPVLVLPRFLGCDLSTQPLRDFLGRLGYRAEPWGPGDPSSAPAHAPGSIRIRLAPDRSPDRPATDNRPGPPP